MSEKSAFNELLAKSVLDKIDRNELVQLALEISNIPSPAGFEKEVAEYIFKWLKENGFEPFLQEVEPERPNVVGNYPGTGGGLSLLFNSHMDHGGGSPDEVWLPGELKPEFNRAWLEGDRIFGANVRNDDGPMAAFMIAAKAIKECGVRLKGDLILTKVIGEIERTAVDEFQGPRYNIANGLGSLYMVNHGVVADYALVAECTGFGLTQAEAGSAWFKITIRAPSPRMYTPFIEHLIPFEKTNNAIVRAAKIIEDIEEWARVYEEKNRYEFKGGVIIPKVNIGAIRAGKPTMPDASSNICFLYIDARLNPQQKALDVKRELEDVVKKSGIEAKIELYQCSRGYVGENVERLAEAINRAQKYVCKRELELVRPPVSSMWRDINVFNQAGIPSVTYCPIPSWQYTARGEEIKVEDLVNAAKVYALIALDLCNQER